MGLLGSLAKAGGKAALAPASGSVVGEVGAASGGGKFVSAGGAIADVAADGAAGALSKTGTLAGGLQAGILGHGAFSAGQTIGERLGGTRTDATVDAENRAKAGQSVGENVGEFMLAPGQTVDRLQTGARKMVGEVGDAYEMQQKTKQMETNRRLSRPMSEEHKSNVNQLQGLLGR